LAIFSKKRKFSQFTIGEKVAKKIPKILLTIFFSKKIETLWAIVPKEFKKKRQNIVRKVH
jgi:hypothetical protein